MLVGLAGPFGWVGALALNLFVTMAFFRAGCGGSLVILFVGFVVRHTLGFLAAVLLGITVIGLTLLVP